MKNKQLLIEKAWEDRSLLEQNEIQEVIKEVIALLDIGKLRVAEPLDDSWIINEWIRKAVILFYPVQKMETVESGLFEFHDKIALKRNFKKLQVRVVPGGIVRYGAFLAPGVTLMPSFINIGSYIDTGTRIETWSTIGSCAQIGKNVFINGSVLIGGVLEPIQAPPVIIEDYCYIGSKCNISEGVYVEREAIISANTHITKNTRIIDVSGIEAIEYRGYIPSRSVVIPGYLPTKFPAGEYYVPIALIVGKRKEAIDKKASLNEAIRQFHVSV